MIQLAWRFLLFQKNSALAQWYQARTADHRHRWQPASDLRAWLFTILHNVHISDLRRSAREPRRTRVVGSVSPVHCEPKAILDLVDLDRAIAKLPDPQRRVLLLIGLEEMSYEQAAAVLSLPVGSVRSRLGRARALLRSLTGHGRANPAAGDRDGERRRRPRAAVRDRPAAA
jgi:RNA polymerase sigma-70 factor (ECF subfamily)